VTDTVPFAAPDVAVTVAVPPATAVTRPEETVATDALDVAHDTLAPLIVAPFWSLTVAESCCVAPKDEKIRLIADSVIEVATGAGGTTGAVVLSPHATASTTAANAGSFNLRVFFSFRGHMAANMRGFDRPALPIGEEAPMSLETQGLPKLCCRHSANVD
jgi:hypothetical protein